MSSFSSSSPSSSSSIFVKLFVELSSCSFEDLNLEDVKRMPVLVRALEILKARESNSTTTTATTAITTGTSITSKLWDFISQHPCEMTKCKTYWHVSSQAATTLPSSNNASLSTSTTTTTTTLFLTSDLQSSQQSVSVPDSSMSSLPSKSFDALSPLSRYSRLLQALGHLSTLPSFASIHHNIVESVPFLLDSTYLEEICIILVIAVMQGNSSDFVSICKPLFALPQQFMVRIFSVFLTNAPILVNALVDVIEIMVNDEKKIDLSSSSSSSSKLSSVQLYECKCSSALLALVSTDPVCIGAPLRYELMRRQLFPQLCIDITCRYLMDAEKFVDSTILTPSTRKSSSVGRWLVSALTTDMLDFVTTLSVDKLGEMCANLCNDSSVSQTSWIESINAPARVVSIVQLISAGASSSKKNDGCYNDIVFSESSHSGFIDCLKGLLRTCNNQQISSEHRVRMLHVVYSMSLLRVAALAGCMGDRDRNKLSQEVSSIAECIHSVLICSKMYEKPLLHVFFSSLLGPSSELSILRDVLLGQLDIPLTLTDTYLPMQWIGKAIKLLVEEKSACIPSTEKEVTEHRNIVTNCVLSTPVPLEIHSSLTSSTLPTLGDWLSCIEIIFRNPKYVFDASKFSIHDKMVSLIKNSSLPVHASIPSVIAAWVRRVIFAKNRAIEIGQCLFPNEVQELVHPLRNSLLTDSSASISIKENKLLPAILACYCTLLQHQFLDLGGTGEIKCSIRRDIISDPFMSQLQDLPLTAGLFYLREWCKHSTMDTPDFALKRILKEFEELVEKFRPEIRIHKETVMKGLEPTITSNIVRDFIERRYPHNEQDVKIEDGDDNIKKLQPLKRPRRNYCRLESMGCKELFNFGSKELVILAIEHHRNQDILDFDIVGSDSLDRLVAIFDVWQTIHQLVPCTAEYQLATINTILDTCVLHESHSTASRVHISRNGGAILRMISTYNLLIVEPIILFKLSPSYVRNPFVLRVILFLLRGTLVASQESARRILKRDTPQEGDPHIFGVYARWERSKLEYNVPLDMYLPIQDIMIVRFLCHFVNIVGSLKTEMDFHSIHLVSMFLEEFFTYASHFQQCTLYSSIMSHGIEEYTAFEVLFSRPHMAIQFAEVLHDFVTEFNRFLPLPSRFYYRDSISREAASNVHDKVVISSIDGISNTSPQRHFEGILRHLSYFFRLPYVSDELEVIRKHILNATCPFLIGALCMMEAPYLFDDIVNNCLKVVESIKIRDEDLLLKPSMKREVNSDNTVFKVNFMGDVNATMKPCYPHAFETLKDMLMNIKGEDTSALKKFAYTLFGSDDDYHGFTPGLHLKHENQAGSLPSSSSSSSAAAAAAAAAAATSDHAPGIIEDYGKMVVEDISWSATRHFKREVVD